MLVLSILKSCKVLAVLSWQLLAQLHNKVVIWNILMNWNILMTVAKLVPTVIRELDSVTKL